VSRISKTWMLSVRGSLSQPRSRVRLTSSLFLIVDRNSKATNHVLDVSSRKPGVVDPILEASGFVEAIEEYDNFEIDVCKEKLKDIADIMRKTGECLSSSWVMSGN
jgi:hypothetical protein